MIRVKKILVYWDVTQEQKNQIRKLADSYGYITVFTTDQDQAEKEAENAEILFGDSVGPLKKASCASWFCTDFAGADAYLAPGVMSDETVLSNSSGAYGVTIAEHIVMVTLMMMRNFRWNHEIMRGTDWSGRNMPMASLYGSRITALGTGDIGTTFAERARAFRPASIVGVNRSGRKPSDVYDRVVSQEKLSEVLPETDLLVMSLPGTSATKGILNEEMISLLPESAFIVNVGRGSAVDEEALVNALNSGKLAGAALDVMQNEPLPMDSPLRSAKNILLTPHVAGLMNLAYTKQKAVDMFCEDFTNYVQGKPLKYRVDKRAGY